MLKNFTNQLLNALLDLKASSIADLSMVFKNNLGQDGECAIDDIACDDEIVKINSNRYMGTKIRDNSSEFISRAHAPYPSNIPSQIDMPLSNNDHKVKLLPQIIDTLHQQLNRVLPCQHNKK